MLAAVLYILNDCSLKKRKKEKKKRKGSGSPHGSSPFHDCVAIVFEDNEQQEAFLVMTAVVFGRRRFESWVHFFFSFLSFSGGFSCFFFTATAFPLTLLRLVKATIIGGMHLPGT